MADKKLSELTELVATPADDDEVYIRDVSEPVADESKRITMANLLAGAGGGATFLTVAAADTPATLKNRADYVGDGTNNMGDVAGDEAEINTALGIADTVILCPGTYWINNPISMVSGKALLGGGAGCIIKIRDSKNANLNIISASSANRILITNLKLDGNKDNQASGIMHGVNFATVTLSKVVQCWIEQCRGNGVHLESSSHYNTITGNSFLFTTGIGAISLTSSNYNVVTGNYIGRGNVDGIMLFEASYNSLTGNVIRYTGGHAFFIRSNSKANTITGNVCEDNIQNGVYLIQACDYNNITGNVLQRNGWGGIYLEQSSNHNTISNNTCIGNTRAADNTYDNINLQASDYNLITGNMCRRGALANKNRYGINIADDSCDRNCLIGNDLYDSGSTGDLNDVPTTNPTLKHDNRNNAGTGWLAEV